MKKFGKYRFLSAVFFILLFCLIFLGCKNKKEPEPSFGAESFSSQVLPNNMERIPVLHTLAILDTSNMQFSFSTTAHRKYLDDPLEFYDLPDGGIPTGPTAVVGSDVCLFYPVESISSAAELESLPAGELIPFTTIIPLGEKLTNSSATYGDMFSFQGNYNYFYKTTWNGQQGIVFGADLYGIENSNEENRLNALLYKNNGYFEDFYPITGYDRIRADILGELEVNGLAFQEVRTREYSLSYESPDDMISLYMNLLNKPTTTIFVTTDLAAHASHLVFARMLQYLEEEFFFPQLVALTDEYINVIEQKRGQISERVYDTSLLYFQTAKALLALAPKRIIGQDFNRTVSYQDVDPADVLKDFPAQVVSEIEKMNAAQGLGQSSIFDFFMEDYSQYKVRGHYTKNGVLGAYFRALMWYGRINFNLSGDDGNTRDLALQLAPVAFFITDITENSPQIKQLWQALFDPITELIGASDDISFYELAPLWNRIKGTDFNQWYNNPVNLETFISTQYRELRPPSISGSSLLFGPYAGGSAMEDRRPPMGWRLFGQRYTLDSEIHYHLSPPRYITPNVPLELNRNMVMGLDILKVLGSRTADWLLRQSDYPKHPGLEERMNSLQQSLENLRDDYWFSTYYTNILYQIKTLAQFENGIGFYFTEKPGWNLKAMNSAHGTWAELRHDTILYVKQNYAEMGGGREEPTFRTRPLPRPVHYIEPNIPFWNTSIIAFQKIYQILEKYNYLDGRTAQVLNRMHQLFTKAAEISMLQAEDREVSSADLIWISRFARELATIVVAHIGGNQIDDRDSLRMALVADVYTNAEIGMVLQTAVGIPYRLYIPLNDGQGGKRIAIGYGFSYHEFSQPISRRLNNDEWRAIAYSNSDMDRYLPFWMQGRARPAR